MKRRSFLGALGILPTILLESCNGSGLDSPNAATIFTGVVIDENGKPLEGIGFQFAGETGGFNPKSTFDLNTQTDAKGYYYLEKFIPKGTGFITFKPTGSMEYSSGSYDYLCLVNGVYQTNIPFKTETKNELNFKFVKRK